MVSSVVASARPPTEYLHTDTRSQLRADYSADHLPGDAGASTGRLNPLQAGIVEEAATDEARLAQTELRITAPGDRSVSSRPLLTSFAATPTQVAPALVTSTEEARPRPASTAAPNQQPAATRPPPTPVATATPAFAPLPVISCSLQSILRSLNSLTATTILFSNRRSEVVKIYRLNLFGSAEFKADLNPGEQVLVDTYVTHPWLVTDAGGNCYGIYQPRPEAGIALIQ